MSPPAPTSDSGWVAAAWAAASVALVAWLVTLGIYSLVLLGVSAMNQTCDPPELHQVETTWTPPGYACRRYLPTYRNGDVEVAPRDPESRLEGPGPKTAMLQLFLLATPPLAWWVAGISEEAVTRRRRIADVLIFGGIGLGAVGSMAVAVGSTGLASIFLVVAAICWGWGYGYRRRHRKPVTQEAAEGLRPINPS